MSHLFCCKIAHRFRVLSLKELSLCHKLWIFNPCIFATQCRRPWIFQTMNSIRSNNLSLKYHRFTTSTSKDIEVYIFDFVPKTQFLYLSVKMRKFAKYERKKVFFEKVFFHWNHRNKKWERHFFKSNFLDLKPSGQGNLSKGNYFYRTIYNESLKIKKL